MKALTNNRQLLSAYEKGDTESVAKDLNRYQAIESDREWEDGRGHLRRKTFLVKHSKGVARWHVKQLNGTLLSVGVVHTADLSKPIYTA